MNNAQRRLITAGYADLPFGKFSECEAGDVGVLGVPSEVDGGPRSGTSLAPDALRRMSGQLGTMLPANGRDLGNLDLSGDWSCGSSRRTHALPTERTDCPIGPP